MKKYFKYRYRIVTDSYLGFEAQCWRPWLPFWIPMSKGDYSSNTSSTEKEAEEFISKKRTPPKYID